MPMKIKISYAKLPVVTKTKFCLAVVGMALGFASMARAENPPGDVLSNALEFKNFSDVKWDKILPDLGQNSPEICILRVDPKTHAKSDPCAQALAQR